LPTMRTAPELPSSPMASIVTRTQTFDGVIDDRTAKIGMSGQGIDQRACHSWEVMGFPTSNILANVPDPNDTSNNGTNATKARQTERTMSLSHTSESSISSAEDGSMKSLVVSDDPQLMDNSQNEVDTSIQTVILRRNLTDAFEEIYAGDEKPKSKTAQTPAAKEIDSVLSQKGKHSVSPTGVDEISVIASPPASTEQLLSQQNGETNDDTPRCRPSAKGESGNADNMLKSTGNGGGNASAPSDKAEDFKMPDFNLHAELRRELSQPLVNRVSFYGIIHDINKEASGMSANDNSNFHKNEEDKTESTEPQNEEFSPIVIAVNGNPMLDGSAQRSRKCSSSVANAAIIDEEVWLLTAIDARTETEISGRNVYACPPSFAYAIGERDTEDERSQNTNSLSSSRTQLWKPSRSWWEAKSGKNPWIEPKSHNKRWRYLWPLIHYHKFLSKCIKKLKRNGVDVKTSVSPVAVFLREEVCAVSDHLAAVSKFSSEEWMSCLSHFRGWTPQSVEAEEVLRRLVSTLKLRGFAEPGDIDSPLLRSQIDEQFLRAMAAAREQMASKGNHQADKKGAHKSSMVGLKEGNQHRLVGNGGANLFNHPPPMPPSNHMMYQHYHMPMYHGRYPRYPYHSPNQPPMMYPYHSMHSNHMYTRETVKEDQPMEGNQSRSDPNKKEGNDDNWKEQYPDQPQGPPSQEFPPSNHPVPVQPYQHGPQPYGMYGYMNPYYQQDPYMGGPSPHVPDEYFVYPNESYQHGHNFMMSNGQANSQEYVMHSPYGDNMAWSSNRPGLAPKHDEHESGRVQKQDTDAKEHSDPAEPTGSVGLNERSSNEPDEANRPFNHQLVFDAGAHTPMKYTPHRPQSALSPYWGHLDQATLAVTGLMSPVTPQRARDSPQARVGSSDQLPRTFVESDPRLDMKKGFINPAFHYYHYRPVSTCVHKIVLDG